MKGGNMRRLSFWLACSLLLISPAFSGAAEWCGFDHIHRGLMEADPEYRTRVFEQREEIARLLRNRSVSDDTIYKIPVVVHILHLGEPVGTGSNISDEQVLSAITVLNEDFRKMAGTNGEGNGVDTGIEFCLAVRDPDDQPTSGIVRVYAGGVGSGLTSYADYGLRTSINGQPTQQEYDLKDLSRWNNSRYYNIWVVTEIDDNNGKFGTMGFAYLPPADPEIDGMVVVHKAVGTVGTAEGTLSRTVTHEMGHAMGLYHTFEGDAEGLAGEITYEDLQCPSDQKCGSSGDCIDDTDPHIRSRDDCRQTDSNECVPGKLLGRLVHNYMDYSSETCQNEFTAGQRERMRAAILKSRESLLTSNGCVAVTEPVTDFSAPTYTCTGNIAFKDQSTNGPTSWSWSFPGGSPETSAEQNPTIAYNTPGTYEVSLTATNNIRQGTTQTKNISVYDHPADLDPSCSVNTLRLNERETGIGIYNVSFGDIDHSTESSKVDGGSKDFSCTHITMLNSDRTYEISIEVGTPNEENLGVYIDYDNDGLFTDSERIFESSGTGILSGTINNPEKEPVNDRLLRMRVISDFKKYENYNQPIAPCSDLEYGQAEDYGIVFKSTAAVQKGDIVKNDVIDLEDAITALKILADIPLDKPVEMAAEVDGNSAIDMKEAIFILQWVSGLRDN